MVTSGGVTRAFVDCNLFLLRELRADCRLLLARRKELVSRAASFALSDVRDECFVRGMWTSVSVGVEAL